jgi:hypothetical protein
MGAIEVTLPQRGATFACGPQWVRARATIIRRDHKMPQRTDFESFPGTRHDQIVPHLRNIVTYLSQPGGEKFKGFRDHLRTLGLWDKEKSPATFSLVDLSWDRKEVKKGPLATKIGEAKTDDEVQELLFNRLRDENILLLKYVLEALDVEGGGRLHSVHELYRMITSYVYPGDYMKLPCFQAWIQWLAATGYIRMVGIRWALTDKGREILPQYKGMDLDEIMEDLEEEDSAELTDDVDVTADAVPPDVADEDDLLGGIPQPDDKGAMTESVSTPDLGMAQESEERADEGTPQSASGPGASPEPELRPVVNAATTPETPAEGSVFHEPLAAYSSMSARRVLTDSADMAIIVEKVRGWWGLWSSWPSYTIQSLGVDTGPDGVEGDSLLAELGVLALLLEGFPPQPQIFALVRRIRQCGFFGQLAAGHSVGEAIDTLGDTDSEPWLHQLTSRLFYAHGIYRRVGAQPQLMEKVVAASTGVAAVQLIRRELFGGSGEEAPFWVLRELAREGFVESSRMGEVLAVPTRRLVENAYRIGLISHPEPRSFEDLLGVSRAVSTHFGAESGYGEALEVMDRALGPVDKAP